MSGLIVVGAGGFGREVIEILRASSRNLVIEGVVDDRPVDSTGALLARLDVPYLGPSNWLLKQPAGRAIVIAVGSPSARRALAERLAPVAPVYPVLVHPDATLGRDVEIGPGVVVAAGARLSTHICLGEHVHIDQNATVGHDTTIGAYTRLNPQACISGSVTIGQEALIGASATVLQGLTIGAQATVGAGSVVTRSVDEAVTVYGVPARKHSSRSPSHG